MGLCPCGARNLSLFTFGGKSLLRGSRGPKAPYAQLFPRNGADVNARNVNQRTPLHYAAQWGHHDVVIALLVNGADIEARDRNGQTALDVATQETIRETLREADRANRANQEKRRRSAQTLRRRMTHTYYEPGGQGARSAIEKLKTGAHTTPAARGDILRNRLILAHNPHERRMLHSTRPYGASRKGGKSPDYSPPTGGFLGGTLRVPTTKRA